MSPTLTGKIIYVGATTQVSDKFKKREFALEVDDNGYIQKIALQVSQDRCELLDKYRVGFPVTVHINIKGREWSDPKSGQIKYFNTLEAWKIEDADLVDETPTAKLETVTKAVIAKMDAPASDDLPF